MLQILLHSSKTMRREPVSHSPLGRPQFLAQATELADIFKNQDTTQLAALMKISPGKAAEVEQLYRSWSPDTTLIPAIDAFLGDIYSGLQVQSWSDSDRQYAHQHLLILSGLYGALRACDGIRPYRLEMGYKLPGGDNLYQFWGDTLAATMQPQATLVVNLSAVEYTRAILPYLNLPVVTPRFLTVSPKTGEPVFVTVHTKIARGAFASWLIRDRISDPDQLPEFSDLGYAFAPDLSTSDQPTFVCQKFLGIGLSVRLS